MSSSWKRKGLPSLGPLRKVRHPSPDRRHGCLFTSCDTGCWLCAPLSPQGMIAGLLVAGRLGLIMHACYKAACMLVFDALVEQVVLY